MPESTVFNGQFHNRKIFPICCITWGAIISGLFILVSIADPESSEPSILAASIFFILSGVAAIIIGIFILALNRGTYVTLTEHHISARYNYGKRLELDLSDILFARCLSDELHIMTYDGKKYVIRALLNAYDLCFQIAKSLDRSKDNTDVKAAFLRSKDNEARRNKLLVFAVAFTAALFVLLFVCVMLTGYRDFDEFSNTDWIIFTVFAVFELASLALAFVFAGKAGRLKVAMEDDRFIVRRYIIETSPEVIRSIIGVFTDCNYYERVIMHGTSFGTGYTVEHINGKMEIESADGDYITEELDCCISGKIEDIRAELESLHYIDITDTFHVDGFSEFDEPTA